MLTAVFSFLGVVIGASLQYFFTRHIENQRHLRDLRSKAYMDYLKCVCEQAQYRYKSGSSEQKELFSRTGDAKARICLYGSKKVISAFSCFEELGASMGSPEQRNSFVQMVLDMRNDSGSEDGAKAKEIQNVILGIHT